MNRLAYVELENFRSFRKSARITLPEKGLVRIQGLNHDTGGESGAGKSTVALAINYALGRCPFPATELKSWGVNNPPLVKLGFADGSKIERGKSLSVSPPGEKALAGSSSQKEEWISQKLFGGYDLDMVMALTYRGQGLPGLFLSKTDAEKKEFLTRLLGLDKFEQVMDVSSVSIKRLRESVERSQATCDAVNRTINDLGPVLDLEVLSAEEEWRRGEVALHENEIVKLRDQISALAADAHILAETARDLHTPEVQRTSERLRVLRTAPAPVPLEVKEVTHWESVVEGAKARITRLTVEDRIRRDALMVERDRLLSKVRDLNRVSGASPGLLREQTRLAKELQALEADTCPTCERVWDRAQTKKVAILAESKQIEQRLAECSQAVTQAEELQREIAALPAFEPNPMIAKMQQVQSDASVSVAKAKQAQSEERRIAESDRARQLAEAMVEANVAAGARDAAVAAVNQDLQLKQQALRAKSDEEHALVDEAQRELQLVSQRVWSAQAQTAQRSKLDAQAVEAQGQLMEQQGQLAREEDFLALVGREGFLGSIFDEVLAEISDETNQLLASVANTRHCTLRFDSESTTKAGTIQRAIKPVVTIHGHEAALRSGPSGGMYSVLQLAVDLALGAVVSRRTGMCPGWLILDESFDGLGAVEKESALEILQRYANERLVLVVDHTSEFQGAFTQSVMIEHAGGDSWVKSHGDVGLLSD